MSLTENPEGSYAEEALQKYGYQQEFRRELKRFASFAKGFSFISANERLLAASNPFMQHHGKMNQRSV